MSYENLHNLKSQEVQQPETEVISPKEQARINAVFTYFTFLRQSLSMTDIRDLYTIKRLEQLKRSLSLEPSHIYPRDGRTKTSVYTSQVTKPGVPPRTHLDKGLFVAAYTRRDMGGTGQTLNSDIFDSNKWQTTVLDVHATYMKKPIENADFMLFLPLNPAHEDKLKPFDGLKSPVLSFKNAPRPITVFEDPAKIEDFYANMQTSINALKASREDQ